MNKYVFLLFLLLTPHIVDAKVNPTTINSNKYNNVRYLKFNEFNGNVDAYLNNIDSSTYSVNSGTSVYSGNANNFDGLDSSKFAKLASTQTFTGQSTFTKTVTISTSAEVTGNLYTARSKNCYFAQNSDDGGYGLSAYINNVNTFEMTRNSAYFYKPIEISSQIISAYNTPIGANNVNTQILFKNIDATSHRGVWIGNYGISTNNGIGAIGGLGTDTSPYTYNKNLYLNPKGGSVVFGGDITLSTNNILYLNGATANDYIYSVGGTVALGANGYNTNFSVTNVTPESDGTRSLGSGTSNDWNVIYYHTLSQHSDMRDKENIKAVDMSMLKTNKLPSPKSYNYKNDKQKKKRFNIMAQDCPIEVTEIDKDGKLMIHTDELIAYLCGVVKLQGEQIINLQKIIEKLEKK